MNTTITLFNSSGITVPASDINKWKEDVINGLEHEYNSLCKMINLDKKRHDEKWYKDEIQRLNQLSETIGNTYVKLSKTAYDFQVHKEDDKEDDKKNYSPELIALNNEMVENTAKIYNAAIASDIHDMQSGIQKRINHLNYELKSLQAYNDKVKYELSLIPSSIDDVKQNIYTFVQNILNNISDDFNDNYTAIIFNEIMDKQDDERYEETISTVVTQHALKSIIKKMSTKIFKRYEEIMLKFASAYFQISDESIYDKQKCIKRILHDFEIAFKGGMHDWLLYCTNSDTIPSFPTSVKAKSMTISRMQSYNQRIENSEPLFVTKYLKIANETLDPKRWFDEEELKNASENIFKRSSSGTVEEMDDEEVPKPKVEKTMEEFVKELGTRTLTIDELTDAYNKFFGTNLAKVGVGRKISGSKLFNKDVKNRVTVYYVK